MPNMRICYIHQYFVTPMQGGATRSYHLAKGMVQHGIQVDMITAHEESFYDFKQIDGINVHYLPVAYSQQMGFLRRIWSFLSFVWHTRQLLRKVPRPDYLYITSTPLTTGLLGLWAKRKLAIPFIFEVRDLWPDAPIQVGVIRNPLLKQFLWTLEKRIYRHALKVIALSPGIANAIRQKEPLAEVFVVPNFADTSMLFPEEKTSERLQKYGLQNTFTLIYAGAIGQVNALDELLALTEAGDFQCLVMGEGSELVRFQSEVAKRGLTTIKFFPFGSKKQVRELMSCADMAVISFKRLPIFETNSPNKFFDALAMGKAILINQKGWLWELVKNHELGIYHPLSHTQETTEALKALSVDSVRLKQMQSNARGLAEKYFSAEIALAKTLHIIDAKQFPANFNDAVYIRTA
jgi:glycosyltransferase involved in cell wall biosynthesis